MANGHALPLRFRDKIQPLPPLTPTVFVIDDEASVRDSLVWLLTSEGFNVMPYESAEAFLDAVDPTRCGCVLADVRLPGMSGIGLQKALQARGLSLQVIMVTGYADVEMAVTALRHGAYDFLEKPIDTERLVGSVRQALARDDELRRTRLAHEAACARLAALSAREREVLALVMDGAPSKVIAYDLRISQKTVEAHRANIMLKMKAESLAQLIRLGLTAQA